MSIIGLISVLMILGGLVILSFWMMKQDIVGFCLGLVMLGLLLSVFAVEPSYFS
jgi:lipid-A-disaccharide synthase-like uncharacterized protein